MLDTDEEKRRFLASEEMWSDPDYMKSMDTAYHSFMQDNFIELWRRFCRNSDNQRSTTMAYDTDAAARHIEDDGADNDRCEFCGSLLFKKELDEDGNEFVIECRNETCQNYLKDVSK
jgi:hypothetical protein